ncbi:MAG: hypothetical protein ACPL2D_10560 [Ignavibacteria bacterium]
MKSIEITKGNPATIPIKIMYSDGTPFDLTGKTIFFTVKKLGDNSENDDNAVIKKTITTHIDPVNGKSSISLSKTDTNIDTIQYKWDIKIYNGVININSKEGRIKVNNKVTYRTS